MSPVSALMMSLPVRRYYGLSVWFPDVIKHLQADDYASRVKFHNDERIEDLTFNFTLENQIHKNGVFINDRSVCLYSHIKDRIRHLYVEFILLSPLSFSFFDLLRNKQVIFLLCFYDNMIFLNYTEKNYYK